MPRVAGSIGGFYDHVIPPHQGVAADEAPCTVTPGCPSTFDFKRLGGRVPGFLVSPWIPAGAVFQEPKGKSATSQFDLSSIPATAKALFNLSHWLTRRDEWAGAMDELLTLDAPTNQGPMHLPDAMPGYGDADPHGRRRLFGGEDDGGVEPAVPQHCSLQAQTCEGMGAVTTKQKRKMEEIAALTMHPLPDIESMDFTSADRFLAQRFADWMAKDYPRY